jgi:hypothetical protein
MYALRPLPIDDLTAVQALSLIGAVILLTLLYLVLRGVKR